MKKSKLYLASQSLSRKQLLAEAGFEFEVIFSRADEDSFVRDGFSLEQLTQELALFKMNHVCMPAGEKSGERCFVITADSMCVDAHNVLNGKPRDFQDAVRMVEAIRDGNVCSTGFCVDRKMWDGACWKTEERILDQASAQITFDVPRDRVARYFEQLKKLNNIDCLKISGGFSIRGVGAQFVKEIHGSYTTIVGLPMYEVRCALEKMGYFE